MPQPTRRQVLQYLGAAAAGAAVAVVRGPSQPALAAATNRPTGTGYVRYEDLYRSGRTLQQVIQAVPSGNVLTFPEGQFTFRDFTSPVGYYDGIRITPNCRGLIGSGRNTVFSMVANSSSKAKSVPAQGSGGSNPCTLMKIANVDNAVLQNFSLIGTPQGHLYNGLAVTKGKNALLSGLYLQGASPGDSHSPPGETAGIGVNGATGTVLRDSEIDGRDASGRRLCAAPMNWVSCTNVSVENVYAHHAYASGCTFYNCVNISTTDLRSEYNGTGSGRTNGSAINHEDVSGTIRHTRPTLIIDCASGNTGMHITLQNGVQDVRGITITDVTHDAGPSASGCFSVMSSSAYKDPSGRPQKQTSKPTVTRQGVTLTPVDSKSGTGGARADKNYIWYH
jgi:hypothetical protein